MSRTNEAMRDLLRYGSAIMPRERSRFDKSHSHTTTLDSGYIVPVMWDRVLPGDEKEIQFSGLCRMTTPLHPVMDSAKLDTFAFFIPDRLWWIHAKEFYGENLDADFNEDGEYVMPYITSNYWAVRNYEDESLSGVMSLNDYLGFPVMDRERREEQADNPDFYCSAGLHRSYQLIWNEWFRNSSIQPALTLNTGDTVSATEWETIKQLRKANRYPDYFTTLLREPQAGDDVMIPLDEYAPVVASDQFQSSVENAIHFSPIGGTLTGSSFALGINSLGLSVANTDAPAGSSTYVAPDNLYARLDQMTSPTISNLRSAITIQHFKEITNLAGRRFQSIIKSHFGTFTPDDVLQRPELLGMTSTTIGMRQVVQQGASTEDSPLGNVAAVSVTNVNNAYVCNKSFTEPGFVMILCVVRPEVSYSQGINPLIQKLSTYEHYWPCFDKISNQPVYGRNIFADFDGEDSVLGYSSAWNEYRIMQNRVSGLMRPDVANNLASWNYSILFEGAPVLNDEFLQVDPLLIDRTIAVTDEPQFLLDCWFDYKDTKAMSVHSTPGLGYI